MVSDGPIVRVLRHRLIAFATALLISQVAAMAAAPMALYNTKAATDGSALLCECKVEPGAECPMHGGKAHENEARSRRTGHVSPACGTDAAAILTLLAGGTGIAQTSSDIVRPATTAVAVAALTSAVLDTTQPPASPPPRV